jgi:hypothetical protein
MMNLIESVINPSPDHRVLLIGSEKCGLTSLAFRLACEEASRSIGKPVFITNKDKFQANFPHICHLYPSDDINYLPQILERVVIKYLNSYRDLITVLSTLQSFQPPPTMIILDDLSLYLDLPLNFDNYLFIGGLLDNLCLTMSKDDIPLIVTDHHCFHDQQAKLALKRYFGNLVSVQGNAHLVHQIMNDQHPQEESYHLQCAIKTFDFDINQIVRVEKIIFQKLQYKENIIWNCD